jgi:transposase
MKKRKTYSKEFKEEAIRLVKEDGLTCVKVEQDLGIGQGAVSKWIRDKKKLQDDAFWGSGNVRPSEREFKSLHKELARAKRKLEILKKSNRQISSFEKAREWQRLSVFDGSHLKKHWEDETRNMVNEPILERTPPCPKCEAFDDDACPNLWIVKSLLELTRLVGALQHKNPRCLLWFRGEHNINKKATPKACRSSKEWRAFKEMTEWFNNNAGKGRLFSNRSELARVAILQHYGAPTPLLDVTTSLRIAILNALWKLEIDKNGELDDIENGKSPNISVFATPRPLDSINIFTETGLCLIDLVAELPSNCLRPHIQRAGFLGLIDIVMAGLDSEEKPSAKASLDCVRIAKICIKKLGGDFDRREINHIFPPASKYTIIGYKKEDIIPGETKTDDMSGDYLLCALCELNKLSESSDPCPLKKKFPTWV